MRIGVLSDTHLYTPDKTLDRILGEMLADTDLILHAGDIVTRKVLARLEEEGVIAVCGNMDDYEVAGVLPQSRIMTLEGKRIGLVHGWGAKHNLQSRIVTKFSPDVPDLIVFGHTHVPFWGEYQGIAMFNPGCASTGGYQGRGSVGIIEISDGVVQAQHLTF
ncbi:MAG: metallophosphoesterase family protein [Thermodesulfobacteriota bacterium]